jgi:hypothetical protein
MALLDVLITFIYIMFVILGFSAVVGTIGFIIDIVKWSKRPEKFENFEKDLKKSAKEVEVKEVIHNE